MACEGCKNLTEETKAIRGASEMAQKYRFLTISIVAIAIAFVVMAGCMVWAVQNAQRIANEAILTALDTMAEAEIVTEETTTTTTQTVEGDSAIINNADMEQYNDYAVKNAGVE